MGVNFQTATELIALLSEFRDRAKARFVGHAYELNGNADLVQLANEIRVHCEILSIPNVIRIGSDSERYFRFFVCDIAMRSNEKARLSALCTVFFCWPGDQYIANEITWPAVQEKLRQAIVAVQRLATEPISESKPFDFRVWYSDAHKLLSLTRQAGGWFRRCNRNTISASDDPTPEAIRERFEDLEIELKAEGQVILLESDIIRHAQVILERDFRLLWPLLEPAYFDLRDIEAKGLGQERFCCAWLALNELAKQTQQWAVDVWAVAHREKRGINSGEWCNWMDRATWLGEVADAIQARLLLEKSWLLKTATPPLVVSETKTKTPPPPPANTGGRPAETTPERAKQVVEWWEQFKKAPKPKGYETPNRLRKGSSDDFIEWGKFLELPNFPTSKEEVERCKKRYRDLQPPKSAKTKTPKRH